jgi:hypothetical protein
LSPCREPTRLMESSLTSGRHWSSILATEFT